MRDYIKKIHHVGIAAKDIREAEALYRKLGYKTDGKILVDKYQKVKILIMRFGNFWVELLEPLNDSSPIKKFSESEGKIHHICYEVSNFNEYFEYLRDSKKIGFLLSKPTVSVFGGKKIFFWSTNTRDIIEFIEAKITKKQRQV